MPSELHEALLLLLRDLPTLAPLLLRDSLHVDLPHFTEARIDSGDLTEVRPAEYRADLVVSLLDGEPVHAIVVEAQLSRDPRKRFAWPVYVTNLRAQPRQRRDEGGSNRFGRAYRHLGSRRRAWWDVL